MSLADRILDFNANLSMKGITLPPNIREMNPFREEHADLIRRVTTAFYKRFYDDDRKRKLILGINPGRLGAGVTGLPFTDTKRLESECGIKVTEVYTHEPSSVFVYDMINAYGGVDAFYSDYYINSVCPLGFVIRKPNGREVNYNYYDDKALTAAVEPFILKTLKQQIALGLETDVVWSMGSGKNFKFLKTFNKKHQLFGEVRPLDHPRYVMQYKSKEKELYIDKYLRELAR